MNTRTVGGVKIVLEKWAFDNLEKINYFWNGGRIRYKKMWFKKSFIYNIKGRFNSK